MLRFLFLFCLLAAPAMAQETPAPDVAEEQETMAQTEASIVPSDPYTISDVAVDVTADNAVEARAKAFEEGAALAVEKFIALQGAEISMEGVDPDTLVRDFQVNEEHFSRTRYTALLTYRFKPSAMARLVNPALPQEQALPAVADETPETPAPQQPVDYDAPWNPATPAGTPSHPPAERPASNFNVWPLTVRFSDVSQWLHAQTLITARPELRGYKLLSMSGNMAQLELTTEDSIADIQRKWSGLGWQTYPQGAGLSMDAALLAR